MTPRNVLGVGVLLAAAFILGGAWTHWGAAADAGKADRPGPAVVDAARYPNLQAALDALPDSGGIVRIPPGTYELEKPLLLTREEVRLEGAGDATRLVNRNQEGQPALLIRPRNRATDRKTRIWRVQVAHMRLSGNPRSGDGLRAEAVNEIYLQGLSVDRHGGHGIHLLDCYENPRVVQCNITYNAQAGLHLQGCHDIVVNANQFEENQDAVHCFDGFNLCMNGNNVDDHLRHGVVIENTYGSVVAGNMIEECQGTAMVLDRDCYGITLSANVIAHNMGGGIDLKDAWGCTITGNTFTIVAQRGLVIGKESGRIAVTGNNFSNSYIGGGKMRREKEDPAAGILLEGTSDVVISGNLFAGLAGAAVQTGGKCQRLAVTGNVLTDLHRQSKARQPALELGGAAEALVEDNVFEKGFEAPPPR